MNRCKSIILFCFLLFFLLLLVGACVFFQDNDCIKTVRIVYSANDDIEESVSLFENDGRYYAFLPSYTRLKNTYVTSENNYTIKLNDIVFDSNKNCAELELSKEYNLKITNLFGITLADERIVFMRSDNIPSLSIHLSNGTIKDINSDKKISKKGVANLIEKNGTANYSGSFKGIHGRGNTTWGQIKKPYIIEFSDDTDLLGFGPAKKYCLLANACDESNLRNKMVFDASKEIGLRNSIDSEFVDLYVDSVYYGLYLLTEYIDIGKSNINISNLENRTQEINSNPLKKYNSSVKRINNKKTRSRRIPNNPYDNTGGYIIELDAESRVETEESYVVLSDEIAFDLKNPKYASEEQIEYISGLMNKTIEDLDNNRINNQIDLDSWLKYYLIQEGFANTDIYSIYFYKDSDAIDNKIYAGPIWDFDFSIGSCYLGKDASPSVFYANTYGIFGKIYQIDKYQQAVKKKYKKDFRDLLIKYSDQKLNDYKKRICNSFAMNSMRWKNIQKFEWCNHYDTLQEHIDYLSQFIKDRIYFLDNAWIKNKNYCRLYYKSDGPVLYEKHMHSVEYGKVFGDLPTPKCEGYKFLGYYDYQTNKLYNPKKPITKNEFYIAKWEKTTYVDKTPSVQERIMMKLEDKQFLVYSGTVFIFLIILIIGFKDAHALIKSRRQKNGKK